MTRSVSSRSLPPNVREEVQWFIARLAPDGFGLSHLQRALSNNSLALHRYCWQAWHEYLDTEIVQGFTPAERKRAEDMLAVLEALDAGSPKPDALLFFGKAERKRLEAYCQEHAISKAEAIRQGLCLLLEQGKQEA